LEQAELAELAAKGCADIECRDENVPWHPVVGWVDWPAFPWNNIKYRCKPVEVPKIALQIPGGDECWGCMFLRQSDILHGDEPHCSLFGNIVLSHGVTGNDEAIIKKWHWCPKS
jgi:hypothetical protein